MDDVSYKFGCFSVCRKQDRAQLKHQEREGEPRWKLSLHWRFGKNAKQRIPSSSSAIIGFHTDFVVGDFVNAPSALFMAIA